MTTQPAGEDHAASPISDELASEANGIFWRNYGAEESFVVPDDGTRAMRLALEAAYPAIRQQVAEQIAAAIEGQLVGLLDGFQARSAAAAAAREIGRGAPPAPAESHTPIGFMGTDVGPFIRCSCGKNPSPHHWLEAHWPGDKAEGQRLADQAFAQALEDQAREIGGGQ